MGSELVKSHHLDRRAVVYVRQSTPHQVLSNQESLRLQYALRQRAHDLGWREADIEVIDADLGLSCVFRRNQPVIPGSSALLVQSNGATAPCGRSRIKRRRGRGSAAGRSWLGRTWSASATSTG